MLRLLNKRAVHMGKCEYCRFGCPWRKSTAFVGFLVPPSWMAEYRCTGRVCIVTGEKHYALSGQLKGVFRTKLAEAYPRGLVRRLARAFEDEARHAKAEQLSFLLDGLRSQVAKQFRGSA